MKLKKILVAASLAVASSASMADAVVRTIDLSSGKAMFGRDNIDSSFIDTYNFTLAHNAILVSATASNTTSARQELHLSIVQISNGSANILANLIGNLGDEQNAFHSLRSALLVAGNYQLLVRGVSAPTQASYAGILAVSAVPNAVPEPGSLALMLVSLGAAGALKRRKPAGSKA